MYYHVLKALCKGLTETVSTRPPSTTRCAVPASDVEIILGLPGAIIASLAVIKNAATLLDTEIIYCLYYLLYK